MQNKSAESLNGSSLSFRRSMRKTSHRKVLMMGWTKKSRSLVYYFVAALGITSISLFISSCSSSIPVSKSLTQPIKKITPTAPVAKQFFPDGWADITAKSKQTQIKYWLVNRDFSATMVLREFQTDSLTQKSLMKEESNVIATISLLSKLRDNDPDYRVTRVPAVVDAKRKFSSFAYSEKGLLRRVIVFRKEQKYFELELMQERSSAEFDELTNDLVTFAITLYER